MDFDKICSIFAEQEPYYGIILSAMDRYPTKEVKTLGVRRSGNVFKLGYNPDWLADKDLNTILQCLKHETLHICFNHLTLFPRIGLTEDEAFLENLAEDLEVNCYINTSIMKGVKPYLPSYFGWENNAGTLEYHRRLKELCKQQEQKQKANAKNPQQPCNGGKGGQQDNQEDEGEDNNNGGQQQSQQSQKSSQQNQQVSQNQSEDNSNGNNGMNQGSQNNSEGNNSSLTPQMQEMKDNAFDDHSQWPDDMTEEDVENLKQIVDDLVEFAAEEVEKGRGTIPGEMEGRIKLIRDRKKPRPITDWKKYFRRYIGNEFSDVIKKSRKRESKRFPDAAGNRHRRKSHILVAIDTSGSVSMREYREFFGQLQTMTKSTTFHVVECDSRIQFEYDFNGRIRETLHGGGGTSFEPPVTLYNQNRRKYEGLVYFTDGYAEIPKDTPKETLWVVSSNGWQDRKRYRVNGASAVFIPKEK